MKIKIKRWSCAGYSGKGIPNRDGLTAYVWDNHTCLVSHELYGYAQNERPVLTAREKDVLFSFAKAVQGIMPWQKTPSRVSTGVGELWLVPNFYPGGPSSISRQEAERKFGLALTAVEEVFAYPALNRDGERHP